MVGVVVSSSLAPNRALDVKDNLVSHLSDEEQTNEGDLPIANLNSIVYVASITNCQPVLTLALPAPIL